MERAGKITGKISANPNPVPFGQGSVVISWETNDPAGVEVRVSTSPGEEKLVIQTRRSGEAEIPWVVGSTIYDFRLYSASQRAAPIDSVKVTRDLEGVSAILRQLADEVTRGNIRMAELSKFIAAVMPYCLHTGKFREIFPVWERHGFHVTPVHFYQPIPDTQSLPETLWNRQSELVGINMNDSVQLDLLQKHFPKFKNEYERLPADPAGGTSHFYLNNGLFDGTDALVAYCMVRQYRPRLIIEIGGGFSTLLLGEASLKNNGSCLVSVEPFPQEFLKQQVPGLHSLIEKKVEDIDLDFFSKLSGNDILFIDSSHTVKTGGDVNYLFLEVLPRLNPGVIVHVHDIFLPFEYRRDWVIDEFRFWSEQYLLQAFLTFNAEFEVLMANSYLSRYHEEVLKAAFPSLQSWGGGSFWMRRTPRRELAQSESRNA
jgi:hypothetical protein